MVARLAEAKNPDEKASLLADIVAAKATFAELGKYICGVCEGFGHTHLCFRKTKKKKTKLGCPTRDIFDELIVSKHITGAMFKDALADRT